MAEEEEGVGERRGPSLPLGPPAAAVEWWVSLETEARGGPESTVLP